jgi:flap endonuclease-1
MGVNLKDLINSEPIFFEDLKGKTIAVDALNSLYQFLASIRQADGTPLMDSNKNVTSHLSGLFYRTIKLMQYGIKPIYVFDGKPPQLKRGTINQRSELKDAAEYEWHKAKEEGRIDDAKKYAMRTSRLSREMREEAKDLLKYMGVPVVSAPSEGEAECVHICKKGGAWAVGSQDYDSLLLGSPRLIRGLGMSGTLELSITHLEKALSQLSLTREQLIDLSILVGTDFNEGIKGIGPKKAYKIVKENRIEEYRGQLDADLDEVRNIFLKPDVTDDYSLEWNKPDRDGVVKLLSSKHNFSEDRVNNGLNNLEGALKQMTQRDLSSWF